jgi:hypothetical protein
MNPSTITFAYYPLRRDIPATLEGLDTCAKPGGAVVSLDFAVPGIWYPLWRLYTGVMPPVGASVFLRLAARGMRIGPNIRDYYNRWPEDRLISAWRDAGF